MSNLQLSYDLITGEQTTNSCFFSIIRVGTRKSNPPNKFKEVKQKKKPF